MRGRTAIGLDNMGGSNANVLTNAITPNRNTLGGATGQESINIQHSHSGVTGNAYLMGPDTGTGTGVNNGDQQQGHYHTLSNDLSTTQTIMQPSRLINWLIKI